MSEMVELLDTPTLAKKLGVQANTLEKWRVYGEGPIYTRVGRKIAYHPKDVDAWLATRRVQSTSEKLVIGES